VSDIRSLSNSPTYTCLRKTRKSHDSRVFDKMPRYYKRRRTTYTRRYKRWTPRSSGAVRSYRRSGIDEEEEKWKRAVRRLGAPQTQGGGIIKVRTGRKPQKGMIIPSIPYIAPSTGGGHFGKKVPSVSNKFVRDPRTIGRILGQVGTTADGTPIIDPELNPRFQTTEQLASDPLTSLVESGRGALASLFATPLAGGFAVNAVRRLLTPNSLKTVGRVGSFIGNKTMSKAGRLGEFRKVGTNLEEMAGATPLTIARMNKMNAYNVTPTKVTKNLIDDFSNASPGLHMRTPTKTLMRRPASPINTTATTTTHPSTPDLVKKYFQL